jgi:hypothetical protein
MLVSLAVVPIVALLGVNAVLARPPIGAGQHFSGRVNGRRRNVVLTTVCAGPASGRQGPVAAGQFFVVHKNRRGAGATGVFTQIYAWFEPEPGSPAPVSATMTNYGTQVAIPDEVRVPCEGTGRVEFSSCPYLAPCAFGWEPDFVDVQFVNIAD